MTFTESCKPYINKYGTFNQTPGEEEQNSGNSLLYMSTYYQIKSIAGEFERKDDDDFLSSVYKYFGKDMVLNRYPDNSKTFESHDDYIGIFNASAEGQPEPAFDLYSYGVDNYWSFNNIEPGKFSFESWFGRHPGFIAHANFSVFRKPSLFHRATWIYKLIADSFNTDSMSDKILTWHMIKAYERNEFKLTFCDLAVKIWKYKLGKFPDLMGTVFSKYYNDQHPFATFMKGKI